MASTRVKTGCIYEHERYGEVLVTGIAKMYDEWDVSGAQDDIASAGVTVFFYNEYDAYGGIHPMPFTQEVNEFAKLTDFIEEHDYDMGYEQTSDPRD